MGHSLNGKAYDSYQRCCQALSKLGFVVLAFDPMGQGERVYYPDAGGTRTRLPSADDEHTVPGKQMLLYGDTSTRLQVWDAIRGLDYLASHPMVDSKRLASTGQSGGGTLTMLLAAVDDRLACAAVSMGNTENFACAHFNPPGSTDDAEQNFIGSGPAGFDRWDTLYPLAPKPLWIGVSAKDSFGTYSPAYMASGAEEYARLAQVYATLGAKDRIAWYESPLPHGLQYDSRLEIYNWFRRWLQNEPRPLEEEPPTAPEPDRTLWAAESGNVVRSFGGQTPFTSNRRRTVVRSGRWPLFQTGPFSSPLRVLRRVPGREILAEAIEVESEAGVWIPAWLFQPKRPDAAKPILLLAEPAGRNGRWQEGQLYQELARAGFTVCVPDVRGIGDLAPEYGRGAMRYARSHAEEEHYAWASLMLGEPLLKQRTADLVAVAAALRRYVPGRQLTLAAQGKMTVPASFAAAMGAGDALYLSGGLVSFQNVVETEDYAVPFANFLPGLLLHADLPEIVARIAPRRVTIAGAVDASGKTVDTATVQRLYPKAEVRDAPHWSLASSFALVL
jgi:dienelactone hydrolase